MSKSQGSQKVIELIVQPREFFHEVVAEAMTKTRVKTNTAVHQYLVDLLDFFISVDNLFDECDESGKKGQDSLAEMFLKATGAQESVRNEMLKKLGDTSLYISGFFGDSLFRKVVDIDYYAEMGGNAYSCLAKSVPEIQIAQVYREISERFLQFVDVLTFISQNSLLGSEQNLLRLYERYLYTGSELTRQQLAAQGIFASHTQSVKKHKQ